MNSQNSMEFHGIPYNFPWNSMELRLMEFHGKFRESPWNSMENSMEFNGISWNSMEFFVNI
jgi:hypothetical protein